jgi:tRNA 2-thiouridine synthesizing protein E
MSFECNGKTIETDANGYLADPTEWSEAVAVGLAKADGIHELTQEHWDVIHFLREEYFNNNQHQPNDREINKHCSDKWGRKVSSKEVYDLFPGKPSKQACMIAGLPETRRKGGY